MLLPPSSSSALSPTIDFVFLNKRPWCMVLGQSAAARSGTRVDPDLAAMQIRQYLVPDLLWGLPELHDSCRSGTTMETSRTT